MKNCIGMIPFAEDEVLGMSPAHREPSTQALYVAVWRAAPSPLCCSSTPQHLPFSPGRAGGKSDLFCRGEFLGELVKASTVWAFISVERRRGRKERRRWRGVTEESLDTASLVKQQPQRVRGRGGERKQKATLIMKQAERQKKCSPDYVISVILLLCLFFPPLLLIRSLHLAPCTLALQVNNKLLPSPSPFLARFSPSTITLQAFH